MQTKSQLQERYYIVSNEVIGSNIQKFYRLEYVNPEQLPAI